MRPDDFHNDRQSEPGAVGSGTLSAPESVENAGSVFNRNTRPTVEDTEHAIPADLDDHLSFECGMRERVLDQVTQSVLDCPCVAQDDNGAVGAREPDGAPAGQCEMRY